MAKAIKPIWAFVSDWAMIISTGLGESGNRTAVLLNQMAYSNPLGQANLPTSRYLFLKIALLFGSQGQHACLSNEFNVIL